MQFLDPSTPRNLFGWHSPALGMDMPIVRYGHWGPSLLLYPTAQADYLENERFFLIKVLEPLIQAGRVQVFSIDSINKHAWMNRKVPVPEQARRQALYSRYVEEEVVPHIRRVMQDPSGRIAVGGASFGAFHCANQFFRRPDLFSVLIAMSGFYDLSGSYLNGYMDENVYFNNPMSYLPGLSNHETLETWRNSSRIFILSGRGDYELPAASIRLHDALNRKSVPSDLDLWGYDMDHDWPTWRAMLPYVVEKKLKW